MPAKLVGDPLVLFELVIFVMSRLQKIDQFALVVRFVDIDGIIHGEFLGDDYGRGYR